MMLLWIGDLDVYVHKKPRMLIATHEWNNNDENWNDDFVHITNQSINEKNDNYDYSKQNITVQTILQDSNKPFQDVAPPQDLQGVTS